MQTFRWVWENSRKPFASYTQKYARCFISVIKVKRFWFCGMTNILWNMPKKTFFDWLLWPLVMDGPHQASSCDVVSGFLKINSSSKERSIKHCLFTLYDKPQRSKPRVCQVSATHLSLCAVWIRFRWEIFHFDLLITWIFTFSITPRLIPSTILQWRCQTSQICQK